MIDLKIYNSYSRSEEAFKPITPNKIGIYVCGVTVYDLCHVGHARTFSAFDSIVRFFRFAGYEVKFVRNITDIDDKIINRANENKEEFTALTERMIAEMHKDFSALNIAKPDVEPRASQVISEIIKMCHTLEEKGFAYVNSEGDLLFRVKAFPEYGKLSGQDLDSLMSGVRTEISQNKESSVDFVLWKQAKPNEPAWDSPWGKGRPGWHIECSAMNLKELGTNFDIHGGGSDLMFPHHENEIAQSCCATGDKFANYWLHSGMVMVDKEKMSKSLGNFFTIRTLLDLYDNEAVRLFLIGNHYRSPLNYTEENLTNASKSLERLYTALKGNSDQALAEPSYTLEQLKDEFGDNEYVNKFVEAMASDFNTPLALSFLFELVKEINITEDKSEKSKLAKILRVLGNILGILFKDTGAYFNSTDKLEVDPEYINQLISKRIEARKNKDWATADAVRLELDQLNVVLEDGKDGTTWKIKNN